MRTSEVTALLITSRIIFILWIVSYSIFLHIILGTYMRDVNFIRYYLPSYVIINYPLHSIDWDTYFGYEPTRICIFLFGFNTMFIVYMQSLLPYFSRKKPFDIDFEDKDKLKNAG